jgi:predicted ATPase/DNA-binding CsgD family transcriptional regulator/DNA-binding XRE family transcriptional regulator
VAVGPGELRERRQALHLSQADLGRMLGVTRNSVARWERGELPIRHPELVVLALDNLGQQLPNGAAGAPPVHDALHHNLPAELSSFIGREQELADLVRRFGRARLLTITGSGGIGKTRLALRLAADILEVFRDGVWLVELAALADPALLPKAVASVLRVREQAGRPALASVADAIGSRNVLLVLDNCEHLVQACAELVDYLLRTCHGLRVLATSREPLGVAGEVAWSVPPLAVPSEGETPAEDHNGFAAVQLFVERAEAVAPCFVRSPDILLSVGEICRRLDGIPLAIELAAALVPTLSVGEIAARLEHRFELLTFGPRAAPPRHQTLRGTVNWSYELLSEAERRLLMRASVFAGGWSLEAAEVVCDAPRSNGKRESRSPGVMLESLNRLVSKSLVLRSVSDTGESRYRLLETIRAFARDRLAQSGEEGSVRNRHAAYFLGAAEEWGEAAGRGPQRTLWLDRLEEELANFREALRWTLQEQTNEDTRLRWATSMSPFWYMRDYNAEGYAWNVALGAVPGSGTPTLGRARALVTTAIQACNGQIDFALAEACCEEALPIARAEGDALWLTRALVNLAASLMARGDFARATAALEEAVSNSRQAADRVREGMALGVLGRVACAAADWSTGRAVTQASLDIADELGDTFTQSLCHRQLGDVARALDDVTTARIQYEASLARAVQGGHRQAQANALFGLAHALLACNQSDWAAPLLAEGLALARQVGLREEIAAGLEGLGGLAACQGQPRRALHLVGAAAALRDAAGARLSPGATWLLDRSLRQARRALGEAGAAAAVEHGRALPLEAAFALAVAPDSTDRPGESREQPPGLTRREQQVASLIGQGLTNRQIAERLVITQRTVAAHIEHILDKLGFRSRLQVGLWSAQHQIATADSP